MEITKPTWQPFERHGNLTTQSDLPDMVFAFPKQRKEPLTDATHVRNAVARFDQVIDVSDADRALAFINIEKAADYYNIDLSETSWKQLGSHPQQHREESARKGAETRMHTGEAEEAAREGAATKEMGNMTSSQNAALLAQWADLWGGNISLADELVTDDFVTHVAPIPWAPDVGETGGREALKKWISGGYRDLIPDMQNSADVGPIADDHYMVVRWKVEGTYNGGFPGSSPAAVGRRVAFTGTDIVRIEDGKFAEYWLNVDSLFFMQQIGVHEVPALA